MSELFWTKELPTEKGWYWLDTVGRWEGVKEPFMVLVFGDTKDPVSWKTNLMLKKRCIEHSLTDFESFPYFWAGPVMLPSARVSEICKENKV